MSIDWTFRVIEGKETKYAGFKPVNSWNRAARGLLSTAYGVAQVSVEDSIDTWLVENEAGLEELRRYYKETRDYNVLIMFFPGGIMIDSMRMRYNTALGK